MPNGCRGALYGGTARHELLQHAHGAISGRVVSGGTCREAGYQKPEAHKATKLGTPDAEEEIVALEPPRTGACKNQYEVPSNHGSR